MISAIQNCLKFVNRTHFGKRFIVLGNPNLHVNCRKLVILLFQVLSLSNGEIPKSKTSSNVRRKNMVCSPKPAFWCHWLHKCKSYISIELTYFCFFKEMCVSPSLLLQKFKRIRNFTFGLKGRIMYK